VQILSEKYQKILDDLEALKEKISPHMKEYDQLRRKFNMINVKLTAYRYTIKKLLINKVKEFEDVREFELSKVMELVAERKINEEKLEAVKVNSEANKVEIETLETKLTQLKLITKKTQVLITKLENAITTLPYSDNKTKSVNIVEILQEKFSSAAVIGRLCDLFEVAPVNGIEVKHYHILQRLGKYAQAIVVDTQHTANLCIEFIKNHQNMFVNEIITPLTICPDIIIDTTEVLKDYTLLEGVKVEPIENFIIAKHSQIQRLLMHLLKPTAVCEEQYQISDLYLKNLQQKVQVTSFNGTSTFKPGGCIEMYPHFTFTSVELSLFDDETFWKIIETLQEYRMKFLDLQAENQTKNLQLVVLKDKQKLFDSYFNEMTVLLETNAKSITNIKKNIENMSKTIREIKSRKEYQGMMEKFQDIKNKLFAPEKEFFEEFLENNGYESIEKFEEDLAKVLNFDALYKANTLKLEINQKGRDDFVIDTQKNLEDANKKLSAAQNKIDESAQQLETLKEKNRTCYEAMVEVLKQFLKLRDDYAKAEEKWEMTVKKSCEETLNIFIAMADNFRIILNALIEQERLLLTHGSITDILRVPEMNEFDENFDIVERNLEG
jgi:chromosome segregation ATPase